MLRIYNTLARKKQLFKPLKEGVVHIYVCGPTVYDYPHIGHARTYVAFDFIVRYLRFKGYKVKYVVNITDVDDKIITRAKETGEEPQVLADRFEKIFFEDIKALGIQNADVYPRVTEHIPDIINSIQKIIENGFAYTADGDVYFSVEKVKNYGRLSHQTLEEMRAGARVEPSQLKRNPMDFVLWKSAKEGEPSWNSPWGRGRPGWHIECSVMSSKYLGDQFDIHGGAMDLIFPHHENEILQSEAATKRKPFVKYWLHTGFLNVKGEKMSKSLGNFITIRELLQKYDAETFRFFVLSTHYRSAIDFTYENLEKAKNSLERLYNSMEYTKSILSDEKEKNLRLEKFVENTKEKFYKALDDDFNTPKAFAILFNFSRKINRMKTADKSVLEFFSEVGKIFGILKREYKFPEGLKKSLIDLIKKFNVSKLENKTEKELIEIIINIRDEFRKKKDYKTSDEIRKALEEIGVHLEDKEKKTIWKIF